ncbi:hypothetical protein ALQ77_200000 [Pseudomonas corrugata]|uniref:Uncharacterized protein n=1 Tax=Pseudomonas corrugata TaxID=47879 RepID=A0A3M3EZQ0_9PSED|nr:hypothetical protein ALQ77_200000 [Pseudomonas corrugata]
MTTAETKHTSHSSNALDEAAQRALDYYLKPKPVDESPSGQLFVVAPDIDTETLLANASEDLLSISAIAADLPTMSTVHGAA